MTTHDCEIGEARLTWERPIWEALATPLLRRCRQGVNPEVREAAYNLLFQVGVSRRRECSLLLERALRKVRVSVLRVGVQELLKRIREAYEKEEVSLEELQEAFLEFETAAAGFAELCRNRKYSQIFNLLWFQRLVDQRLERLANEIEWRIIAS